MKQDAQLALAVQLPDDETFNSYIGKTNETVVTILSDFVAKAGDKSDINSFYLFGGVGVGKSHLLHAASNLADELGKTSLCISMSDHSLLSVEALDGLEQIDLICIDDIQHIAGNLVWQQAIFDLFNRVKEQGRQLIISGETTINELGIELPDLRSRLSWGFIEQLKSLSEEEKMAAVEFRAVKRGLSIQPEVIKYLFTHYSRDMAKLIQYLDTLDKLSIREQRKITIPFVKEALNHEV
ncbi:DnaA regulatory inactivator Hda [Thalassotalea sp. M1531]|uniref:DnaA regulatory inactivator Hda n=1 Tax=Thalassotalea algicola TaxID=2716224 RepID=A0A7Y0LFY3_9GAMM|nr:DnaA regulatory inactivator Hda [Thalassotalea algicola]NMP32485.1 DnaA regulatory inactivator Hda [Thalassotalea algicola]